MKQKHSSAGSLSAQLYATTSHCIDPCNQRGFIPILFYSPLWNVPCLWGKSHWGL